MPHRLILADTTVPAGNVIANTTTRTKFTSSAIIIDANNDQLFRNGRAWRITGYGYLSTAASAPGTLALTLMYSNLGSDTVLGTATLTLPAGLTNAGFRFDGYALLAGTGSQAQTKIAAGGMLLLDGAGVPVSAGMVNTGVGTADQVSPTNGSQSTQYVTLGMAAQFSVASASNTVTMQRLIIEALNS